MSLSLDSSGGVAYVPLEGTHIDSRRHPTDPLGYGAVVLGYLRENARRFGLLQDSGSVSSASSRIVRAKIPGLA